MTCLTLFAGAGGADVGLSRAGFTHLACVEGDNSAVATLQAAGFPAVHAWIGGPGPDGQPQWHNSCGAIDLLWASPPCQPYSQGGEKLGASDVRDGWPATLAEIKASMPRRAIIENVPGCPVAEWSEALSSLGYTVSSATLDAADWGLPSHRRRVFIVAGPAGYRWPTPTHYAPDTPYFLRAGKKPWVGWSAVVEYYNNLRPDNGGFFNGKGKAPTIPAHTVTGHCPQYLTEPLPCICTTDGVGIGSKASRDKLESLIGKRALTWHEASLLMGFPADYPFAGKSREKYRQIGNAVAPIMAQVLCQQITEQ